MTARRFLPATASGDAAVLLGTRGLRAFADGCVSVLLPVYLALLGFSALQIGALTTATLVGSAVATLGLGLVAQRWSRRHLLLGAALLMAATGAGFALVHDFWPLLLIAFAGTLNPSSGDVSVFLPLEQSLLPQTVAARERTALFARYSFVAALAGASGALAAGLPELLAERTAMTLRQGLEGAFLLYALLALVAGALYTRLSSSVEPSGGKRVAPLGPSRRRVYTLAALFSLDSFASGLAVQSLLALWLFRRFDLSLATTGTIFFWAGLLQSASFFVSVRLSRTIGLVNTMVFTHLPANGFLMLTALMPSAPLAVACLLARSALSQMDVPARNSYVMAVVTPEERPAAASVTAVPRSLAAASSPFLSGALLSLTTFGWPLIAAGALKVAYDLLLLRLFRGIRPPEEE